MISKVSIRNFKCLRDVLVDLERFTVFVGPNASGKSSILHALDVLCRRFRVENLSNHDEELQQSLTQGATDQIELACESAHKAYRYRTRSPSPRPKPRPPWTGDG